MSYYIKNIWGPGGQEGYPFDDDMHFAENQRSMAERFADCDGFLVYETGHRKGDIEGAKTIYGKGVVTSNEAYFNKNGHKSGTDRNVEEKVFSYTVKIKLNLRVNPKKGVPLYKIREIIGRPKETMQRRGGLIKLTREQFNQLSSELEKVK